jgi:phosphatidylserine/phosphatidylglycerophosphate/cardiolipin synthase-like enzyme
MGHHRPERGSRTMATRFLQSGLWAKITSLAKKAKRRYVAVAYLGSGATSLLPLGKRDVLIADVSLAAVRAGQTNPYEVEEYLNRDVEVHSCSNLHAKVFVFDNRVIIGSPNVSENSKDNLIETALLANDPATVTSARGFIFSLMGEHLTPAYVKYLKKEYKKDYTPPKDEKRSKEGEPPIHHPRLWVHRLVPVEFDEKENRLSRSGTKKAREKLRNKRRYTVDVVSYDDRGRFTR